MRALSAIDMALWDLYARRTDQPLYQVLSGLTRVYNTCAGTTYGRAAPTDPGLGMALRPEFFTRPETTIQTSDATTIG